MSCVPHRPQSRDTQGTNYSITQPGWLLFEGGDSLGVEFIKLVLAECSSEMKLVPNALLQL